MRNPTVPARPAPAEARTARRQADAAADAKADKAAKPAPKRPTRKPGPIEAAPTPDLSPGPALLEGPALDELIRNRAYDRYERNGRVPGRDVDDWLAAEAEVCAITRQGGSDAAPRAG